MAEIFSPKLESRYSIHAMETDGPTYLTRRITFKIKKIKLSKTELSYFLPQPQMHEYILNFWII